MDEIPLIFATDDQLWVILVEYYVKIGSDGEHLGEMTEIWAFQKRPHTKSNGNIFLSWEKYFCPQKENGLPAYVKNLTVQMVTEVQQQHIFEHTVIRL